MITATTSGTSVNLIGKQGTTWNIVISLFSDAGLTVPLSLAGYSARGQYRQSYAVGSPVVIEFSCTVLPVDPVTNPNNNKISINVPASTSTACTVLGGYYDIEVYTAQDASVERVMEGSLSILQEVTRAS